MPDPRAFISFDFDNDENQKVMFVGQSKNSRTPFSIQDWSSKSHLPQSQWEAIIADKISRTNMVIVLVGQRAYAATGVAKEIAMAAKADLPFFGVYVDGANTSTPLPAGLARNRIIPWTWDGIANAVSQMMTEGRNR